MQYDRPTEENWKWFCQHGKHIITRRDGLMPNFTVTFTFIDGQEGYTADLDINDAIQRARALSLTPVTDADDDCDDCD